MKKADKPLGASVKASEARGSAEQPPIPVAEWLAEGLRLFGGGRADWRNWRFKCPICGHVQTPADFKALGVDPQSAYQECIGRHLPDKARDLAATPAKNGSKSPCDYAAYGLFRLGRQVISEDGKIVTAFPFDDGLPVQSREDQKDDDQGPQAIQDVV